MFLLRKIMCCSWLVIAALAAVDPASLHAAEKIDYIRDVQPILAEHCFQCHGQDAHARQAQLRLDLRDAALKGGESDGAAIVPGQPAASALLKRIRSNDTDLQMPPASAKRPLDARKIRTLERWIADGAPYAGHWAFSAPIKAPLPRGSADSSAAPNPIDALVTDRLQREGLTPSARAAAETLCRRLHLDLIGLPPSPAEVDEFVASKPSALPTGAAAEASASNDAYAALVDKLLASPRYGEKWARVWLDVARYSDSNGFEKDLPREQWAWRDWVVQALNNDLPYDRFIIEQVAGDLLPQATQEQIIATGFLRNGMINEEGAIVPEQFRIEGMFDRMDCLGKAVLGLSLQCAQCHSHKFDPITQDEYYGLFAFLNDTCEAQTWVYTPEQHGAIAKIYADLGKVGDRIRAAHPKWRDEMAAWEASVVAQEVPWSPLTAVELGSTGGLNHPTQLTDLSIMTLGHPTTKGDIYVLAEPALKGVTGLRLEALTHDDLPFGGPGRSRYGTWAISEMEVSVQRPGSDAWEPLKLVNASADFSEPPGPLEDEWKANFDPLKKRTRGPVAYLIDGNPLTAWRADRGVGLRNQPSVAVVQFEQPLDLPPGTQLKVRLLNEHGDAGNGRGSMQLGRCRLSTTTAPAPLAQPVGYAALLAMQTPASQRTSRQQAVLFAAWRKSRSDCAKFNDEIDKLWASYPEAQTSVLRLAAREPSMARETQLLDRGVWDQPKQTVPPHVPAALHQLPPGTTADRLAFARWLVDARSPLAARVAVNRVWQCLFGMGLVETAEDFGTRAPVPQYLDLLDWLAVDFIEHGWSQKHLIRTIVSSRTYQQSSHVTQQLLERDPQNRWLARGPRFRADAEVVRDLALSAAGLLHHKLGGPSIFPPVPESVLDYNFTKPTYWQPPTNAERYRRSLYLFRKRSMPDPVMSAFDAPNGDFACARRTRTNTPLSALVGLNEPIFVEAAQALALRVLNESGPADADRIAYAFRLCTSRPPNSAERDAIMGALADNRRRLRAGELKANDIGFSSMTDVKKLPADATPNEVAAWTLVARVLLNLDETITKN